MILCILLNTGWTCSNIPPSSRVIARSDCSILNYHVTECLQVLRPPFRSLWRSYPACSPLCNYIGSYIGDCKLDKWRSGDLSLTQLTSGIVVSRAVAPKSHFTHVLQYTLHRQFTTATRTQLTVNLIGQWRLILQQMWNDKAERESSAGCSCWVFLCSPLEDCFSFW